MEERVLSLTFQQGGFLGVVQGIQCHALASPEPQFNWRQGPSHMSGLRFLPPGHLLHTEIH